MTTATTATTASTTAQPSGSRPRVVRMHLLVAAVALAPGLVVAGVAGLAADADAVGAALTGALLVVAVVLLGSVAVDVVSGLMPGASLMIAMLTYSLQLVALLAVLVSLEGSAAYADLAERRWLFAGLLAVLLGWMAGQVVAAVRVRIPAFADPASDHRHRGAA